MIKTQILHHHPKRKREIQMKNNRMRTMKMEKMIKMEIVTRNMMMKMMKRLKKKKKVIEMNLSPIN